MMYDPIADFLTRIRNAKDAKHRYIDMNLSKMKKALAGVLKENHFIDNYLVDDKNMKLRLYLKYGSHRQPLISGLKRISKPSARIYVGHEEIPRIRRGLGIAILSTPQGVIDGARARKEKVGGELLCYVW